MQLFSAFAIIIVFIAFVVFLGARELLKPVDKRTSQSGRNWKLPPGPSGLPIVGNLFAYMKGESTVSFIYISLAKGRSCHLTVRS